MYNDIKVIGFDADDTLWVNEPYFRDIEDKFVEKVQKIENGLICRGCGKKMDIGFVVCPYCKTDLKGKKT